MDPRLQRRRAGSDLVGQRGEADIDAFPGIALGLAVQWLMLAELLEQDHRQRLDPPNRGRWTGNGAGGWLTLSHSRQMNFSRTSGSPSRSGMTSSVSVMSSPILTADRSHSRCTSTEPQDHPLARRMVGEWLA